MAASGLTGASIPEDLSAVKSRRGASDASFLGVLSLCLSVSESLHLCLCAREREPAPAMRASVLPAMHLCYARRARAHVLARLPSTQLAAALAPTSRASWTIQPFCNRLATSPKAGATRTLNTKPSTEPLEGPASSVRRTNMSCQMSVILHQRADREI